MPRTPWKNGLGVTTQLAIHPLDATADAFEWRVSVARLTGSAAFSRFDGVERCLAMLQGEMTLVREGQPPVTMTTESPPVFFSGTVPAEGRVESGSAFDLNLMYRPVRWRAGMHRLKSTSRTRIRAKAISLLCSIVRARVEVEGDLHELKPFDLLCTDRDMEIKLAAGVDAYLIELQERYP
jgi:environmental stress-induced protein Ves